MNNVGHDVPAKGRKPRSGSLQGCCPSKSGSVSARRGLLTEKTEGDQNCIKDTPQTIENFRLDGMLSPIAPGHDKRQCRQAHHKGNRRRQLPCKSQSGHEEEVASHQDEPTCYQRSDHRCNCPRGNRSGGHVSEPTATGRARKPGRTIAYLTGLNRYVPPPKAPRG